MLFESININSKYIFHYASNTEGSSIATWGANSSSGYDAGTDTYFEIVPEGLEGSVVNPVLLESPLSRIVSPYDIQVSDNGGFVIGFWDSLPFVDFDTSTDRKTYIQSFNSLGQPINDPILVGDGYNFDTIQTTKVGITSNGIFLSLWTGSSTDNSENQILLNVYSSEGKQINDGILIKSKESSVANYASDHLISLSEDRFLAVYSAPFSERTHDTNSYAVIIDLKDTENITVSKEMPLYSNLDSFSSTDITLLENQNFVYSYNIGDKFFFKVYDQDGNSITDTIEVDGASWAFEVTTTGGGGFSVVQFYDGTEDEIWNPGTYVDQFDNYGNRVGERATIFEGLNTSDRYLPEIVSYENGSLYIVTEASNRELVTFSHSPYDVPNYTLIDDDTNYWNASIDRGKGETITVEESQLYRAYYGAMGRQPDKDGFDWWLERIKDGSHTLNSMAEGFIGSEEFSGYADKNSDGQISNEEFITHMYTNVFGREPDQAGYDWWVNTLDSGEKIQSSTLIDMTQSNEYIGLTLTAVGNYDFLI